jgi:hypothetical protein
VLLQWESKAGGTMMKGPPPTKKKPQGCADSALRYRERWGKEKIPTIFEKRRDLPLAAPRVEKC